MAASKNPSNLTVLKMSDQLIPIQQSLAWARALESISGRVLILGAPDSRNSFGVLHEIPEEPGVLKCFQGPVLDWTAPTDKVNHQFALFTQESVYQWNQHYGLTPEVLLFKPRIL